MKRADRKLQAVMWQTGEDLPLFTGSPVPVQDAQPAPTPESDPATWDWAGKLFDEDDEEGDD